MPRQNTHHAEHPLAVLREIEQLGLNITIARKRRGETQGQWATKLGVSQPTMARIERGDPSVAMASYVMCMWLINQAHGLADLVAPLQDHAALEREVLRVRQKGKSPSAARHAPVPAPEPRPVAGGQRSTAKPVQKKKVSPAASTPVRRSPSTPTPNATLGKKATAARKTPASNAMDSTEAIHERIRASAAKGNATARGLEALILAPRPKAQ